MRIYLEITSNGYQLSYIVTRCVIIKPEFNKGNPLYPKAIMNNIQKGSVHCNVGAVNINCLLSAVWYSGRSDTSKRDFLSHLLC